MAYGDFGLRHSRWRAWVRIHTPDFLYQRLGLVIPKARDCGDHEWYNAATSIDGCYHCKVLRPRLANSPPEYGEWVPLASGMNLKAVKTEGARKLARMGLSIAELGEEELRMDHYADGRWRMRFRRSRNPKNPQL